MLGMSLPQCLRAVQSDVAGEKDGGWLDPFDDSPYCQRTDFDASPLRRGVVLETRVPRQRANKRMMLCRGYAN